MSRARLEYALERIDAVRHFTLSFLEDIAPDQWYEQPGGLPTHVAWQVGHLAVAQHALCLRRVRGDEEKDAQFLPADFYDRFKLGSVPAPGAENNPSAEELFGVLDAVHARVLAELTERTDDDLDVDVEKPHPAFRTKLGAVEWSYQHELVHAGQIALIRRLLGKQPLR